MTWQWAKRRHKGRRTKNTRWLKKRYFTRIKDKDWVFFETDEKTKEKVTLFKAASIPIKRHIKIRSQANPYALADEPCFEKRIQQKLADKWEGRHVLDRIYKRQNGRCAYCGELIELKTGWNIHHIMQRIFGGKDTEGNLILLHPNCHVSVHLNKFSFAKKTAAPT